VFDALNSEALAARAAGDSGVGQQPIATSSPRRSTIRFNEASAVYATSSDRPRELPRRAHRPDAARERREHVQQRRLPNATFRDRMTLYLGARKSRSSISATPHRGDSVLFVPQDRIVYMSEVFFNEEFPNMGGGYGVS